ncbi:hypothetical protein FRB90_011453 [Tulasnella sp. 427]|nr:hypothetical protein FRB90_011453 [Tulasnella sp. 427]
MRLTSYVIAAPTHGVHQYAPQDKHLKTMPKWTNSDGTYMSPENYTESRRNQSIYTQTFSRSGYNVQIRTHEDDVGSNEGGNDDEEVAEHCDTGCGASLSTNLDWLAHVSNWGEVSVTASLGVINKGNVWNAMRLLGLTFRMPLETGAGVSIRKALRYTLSA